MIFSADLLSTTQLTSPQRTSGIFPYGSPDGCLFVWPHIFDRHRDMLEFVADAYLFWCVSDGHPRFPKHEVHVTFGNTFNTLEPEELYDMEILGKIVFAEFVSTPGLRRDDGLMIDKEEYDKNPDKYILLGECVLVTPVYTPHVLEIMSVGRWWALDSEERDFVYDLLGTCYEVKEIPENKDE